MTPDEIRHIRRTFQFNRGEMARLMSVNYNSIRRWEKGEAPPTGLHLVVLGALHAAALDVEEDEPRKQVLRKLLPAGIGSLVEYTLLSWGRVPSARSELRQESDHDG